MKINTKESKDKKDDIIFYFEDDYSKIIFTPPFRRLQDKAQVFPLEVNDFVRTRLTHSLEVSSIAKLIGLRVKDFIKSQDNNELSYESIPTILASAGLMHDLGNTPFGHAGERAIQNTF
ncbi:deoxyguanosinetriphosphate triphosphohydrolase-like protein [Brachyspira pilosicoli P43/6/78]|uniref:Deoxyguanosinetriphosphate triphosphohydrolase-like protein n=1 Tax=Brachyspira pilosicoli P43/6/78 TaxID=1042417 RepID=A0A3B6VMQ6_BRAPL|nr:HD domain-containing protein [Brachyspira pilosicoli]AGA67060.1 deoxyguanosinetriphosphate triphosphohydrolase-like protein [Brachyspira pilosicoli P43/6/78]